VEETIRTRDSIDVIIADRVTVNHANERNISANLAAKMFNVVEKIGTEIVFPFFLLILPIVWAEATG